MNSARFAGLILGLALSLASPAKAEVDGAPDILILGDSQLSFGAGAAFVDAIDAMAGQCGISADSTTGVIGVRSSSLRAWTGEGRRVKRAICDVDRTWGANAGVYGTLAQGSSPYVQIGQGPQFQFCRSERSPLESVFADGYYRPDLVIMFLLGNSADRWANSRDAADEDVKAFVADIPPDQPCILMTTAPPYGATVLQQRLLAQTHMAAAFADHGGHCSFVAGYTPETIDENLGNASNFRQRESGEVRDPYHPVEAAARRFLELRRDDLCDAISTQLSGPRHASTPPLRSRPRDRGEM
jgi:hypothetical protein